MFEKLREKWTRVIQPLVEMMGDLNPSTLTWASLMVAIFSFFLLMDAGFDSQGSLAIIAGVVLFLIAGIMDALDGALARKQGVDGPYGDFLDHTIDRIVDVGILVAIGMNSEFIDSPESGLMAGLLTLFGSYMGTQAQSVGLGRIYGGFSRADRMVLTMFGLIVASLQAQSILGVVDLSSMHEISRWILLGNSELNGMSFVLSVSAWGGAYTFITRFIITRRRLLE